jgi:hypothetical protein
MAVAKKGRPSGVIHPTNCRLGLVPGSSTLYWYFSPSLDPAALTTINYFSLLIRGVTSRPETRSIP